MRAIVMATGQVRGASLREERDCTPLFPLVDRPFIQHVVEYLEGQGVTVFDFILHHLPEQFERLLGDGTRWNSTFRFHLAHDLERPYKLLQTICGDENDQPLLIVHADRLPCVQLAPDGSAPQVSAPRLFCWRDPAAADATESLQWTGWAWLPRPVLANLPGELDERTLAAHLMTLARGTFVNDALVEVPKLLSVQSYNDLLTAHHLVLNKEFSGLLVTGREVETGLWLSRNVSLHPTVRLVPPVYIGENCRIGKGTQIGPSTVIGKNCVLDDGCTVENSLVFPESYVGEGLELTDVIADRNRLVNVRFDAAVNIEDDFILGNLADKHLQRWLSRTVSQALALVFLGFIWPVLLLTALCLKLIRPGPVLYKRTVVRLPAPANAAHWHTFSLWRFAPEIVSVPPMQKGFVSRLRYLLLYALPALVNIARGELRFVGVSPRTQEAIMALPHDWRALYLGAKVGFITEAQVRYATSPSEDELYSAEAFYSVMASLRYDVQLFLAYWARLCYVSGSETEDTATVNTIPQTPHL